MSRYKFIVNPNQQSNNMKLFATTAFGLFLFILCSSAIPPAKDISRQYVSAYDNVLGTSLELKVSAPSPELAAVAEDAAMNEIDRLNKILSGYNAKSEFSLWLHGDKKVTKVSPELY